MLRIAVSKSAAAWRSKRLAGFFELYNSAKRRRSWWTLNEKYGQAGGGDRQ